MEAVQNIDIGTALLLGVGLAGLCIVVIILFLGVQIIGSVVGALTSVAGLASGVLADPFSCCGCLVLGGAISICGVIALIMLQGLSTCGTPEAINFCTFFGR